MKRLSKLFNGSRITVKIINEIIDQINWLRGIRVSGMGYGETAHGPSFWVHQKSNAGMLYQAKTQEAAQADAYISVKLLDSSGTEMGSAFDAKCIFQDDATAANTCLPDVQTGKPVTVYKGQDGVWYLNLTFTKFTECT